MPTLKPQIIAIEPAIKNPSVRTADPKALAAGLEKRVVNKHMPAEPLSDAEVECLDPGIRDVVVQLRAAGFETTDSGDGVSKPADERVFDYPHVYAVSNPVRLLDEAHRMQTILGDEWMVEAVYMPRSGTCLLAANKCSPALLWEGYLQAQAVPGRCANDRHPKSRS